MTMTNQAEQPATAVRPFHFAMLLPTLLIDVVAPIGIFKALEHFGVSPLWALAGAALAPALNNLRTWATARRIEPLGFMIVAFGVIGTVASLLSGSMFFTLIKDSFLTGVFGLVFLVSLLFRRPLMFYVIRQFVAGEDPVRNEVWKGLWDHAVFRSALRLITVTWGIVYLAEALARVGLAMTLKPDDVIVASPIMAFVATLFLIGITRFRMRMLRERLELFDHLKWPL